MRKPWLVLVVIVVAVVAWSFFEAVQLQEPRPIRATAPPRPADASERFDPHAALIDPKTAEPAPDIGLRGRHGLTHLSEHRGRVVLVDFWATWCAPCHMSIPMIQRLYESEHSKGFEVMGFALENATLAQIEAFAREMGMTYPIGFPESADQVKRYPAQSLPTMVLVDRAGRVRLVITGYDPALEEQLPQMVKVLLDEHG